MSTALDVLQDSPPHSYRPHWKSRPPSTTPHTVESALSALEDYEKSGDLETSLSLRLTQPEFERLIDICEVKGFRSRYSWLANKQLATFTMPTELHESANHWVFRILPALQEFVRGHSPPCANLELTVHGTADRVIWSSNLVQPDVGIKLLQDGNLIRGGMPTVVVEVAYAQPYEQAVKKAWDWLWGCDYGVNAVLVYNIDYPLRDGKLKATLEIWERGRVNEDDAIYVVDDCSPAHHPPESPRPSIDILAADLRPTGSSSAQSPTDASSTVGSVPETTLVGSFSTSSEAGVIRDSTTMTCEYDGISLKIQIRKNGKIIIVDEESDPASENPLPSLPFCNLDFVRPCALESEPLEYAVFWASLEELRASTLWAAKFMRQAKIQKHLPYKPFVPQKEKGKKRIRFDESMLDTPDSKKPRPE